MRICICSHLTRCVISIISHTILSNHLKCILSFSSIVFATSGSARFRVSWDLHSPQSHQHTVMYNAAGVIPRRRRRRRCHRRRRHHHHQHLHRASALSNIIDATHLPQTHAHQRDRTIYTQSRVHIRSAAAAASDRRFSIRLSVVVSTPPDPAKHTQSTQLVRGVSQQFVC